MGINEWISFHDVAQLFPLMSAEEYESLKADIQENGLIQPIWLHEGKIIDGRNRYNACLELGIDPQYRTWDGTGSLVSFVVSLNLQRRHLDSGQRAFVALEVERLLAEEAKERLSEAGKNFGRGMNKEEKPNQNFDYPILTPATTEREPGDDDELEQGGGEFHVPFVETPKPVVKQPQASEQAAKIVGTNRQYVQDAKFIQEKAPDVAEAVKSGTIKLYEAKKVATLPESQRKAVIEKVASGEKTSQAIYTTKLDDRAANSNWSQSEIDRKSQVEKGLTVVAHINHDAKLIQWAEQSGKYVRIDRTSDWGNPFLLPGDGDRNIVIDHYKQYLLWRPTLLKRLPSLKGKVLGCWCYPERCHGNAILEIIHDNNI